MLHGSQGEDRFVGVDPASSFPGRGEVDVLIGLPGADTFVLGGLGKVYYVDPLGQSARSYAAIQDFEKGDKIVLVCDEMGEYTLQNCTVGLSEATCIYYDRDGIAGVGLTDELIAIVQGPDALKLDLMDASTFIWDISPAAVDAKGGSANDILIGGDAADELIGRGGSDVIIGAMGADRLVGVDPLSVNPGRGEIDVLIGGPGSDVFVLADNKIRYYLDPTGKSASGYAAIQDFESGDKIALLGNKLDYVLQDCLVGLSPATCIYYNRDGLAGVGPTDDLVATVQGPNALNLNLDDVNTFVWSQTIYSGYTSRTTGQSMILSLRPSGGSIDGDVSINRLSAAPGLANQKAGLVIGQTGINFYLKIDNLSGNSTAKAALDLAPLLDGLSTTNKRLAYFVYDSPVVGAAPVATPFTYDPIKKAGARFYDLDGNGTADTADLQFVDGGYGDKDGVVNGVVVDPSTAGVVDLNAIFTASANSLTVADPTDSTSPAALTVRATLTAKAASVNQIGYVALNANEADTLTYELVRDRGSILLANLENSDTPNLIGMKFQRDINLINGQKLVFFEVVDTTLESLLAKNTTLQGFGSSFRTLDLTKSTDTAATATKGGNTVALSLLNENAIAGLGELISSQMADAPILDFTGLAGRTLEGSTVSLAREANYDTTIGFYRIQRADGAVLDPITNTLITPGSAGYKAAALSSTNLFSGFGSLAVANGATRTDTIAAFNESGLLAPYATVAQTGDTFFSFRSANSDNLNHFRVLGSNVIGLEDLNGGGDQDFDDNIVSFNFKLKQGTVA
ncbi:MAG: hypothetical protein EBT26_08305 [Microbacteriaceae bacterium]|nr:hypothetical protein [Microbacteriaceae bacterium]